MKTILRSKKGISPILATLLLIVIAVAAVIVTYAWVMTFTATQTTTAGKWINFDSAVINATSDIATIYVRNTGTEKVTIDTFYIDGADYTSSADGLPKPIDPEKVTTVTFNGTAAGLDFISGNTYKLKIAGPNVSWEASVKA